jgi:hypothetical protein
MNARFGWLSGKRLPKFHHSFVVGAVACAFAGALFATSASATVYSVDILADTGDITGTLTVTGTTVTDFTGTASGFGFGGIFDGPVTLGQGSDGPVFVGDNQWAGAPYYVTSGDGTSGGGLLLTNGLFSFRVYDYVDTYNNYGDQLGWFVEYGYNPAAISATISATSSADATPLPAALPLFATGLGALGLLGWRRKRKAAAVAA